MEGKFRIEKLDDSNLLRMQRFDCTSDRFVVIEASDRFFSAKENDVDLFPPLTERRVAIAFH